MPTINNNYHNKVVDSILVLRTYSIIDDNKSNISVNSNQSVFIISRICCQWIFFLLINKKL